MYFYARPGVNTGLFNIGGNKVLSIYLSIYLQIEI